MDKIDIKHVKVNENTYNKMLKFKKKHNDKVVMGKKLTAPKICEKSLNTFLLCQDTLDDMFTIIGAVEYAGKNGFCTHDQYKQLHQLILDIWFGKSEVKRPYKPLRSTSYGDGFINN